MEMHLNIGTDNIVETYKSDVTYSEIKYLHK